jgi:hypothetical protein
MRLHVPFQAHFKSIYLYIFKGKKNVYILPVVKCIPDPIDRPPSIEINPAVFSRYSILAHRFS